MGRKFKGEDRGQLAPQVVYQAVRTDRYLTQKITY